jgi:Uma2 family endonuclease
MEKWAGDDAMQTAIHYYTREEYLTLEATSQEKHEFYHGEIFAMAGGTFNHAEISGNVYSTLRTKLRNQPCRPTNSDMRIGTPSGLMTYPDVAIFCGQPELIDNQRTLLNPVVIIEVLSPSTRGYDQGDKFRLYRSIATFRAYLLIDSECVHLQQFHRSAAHEWILHEYTDLTEIIYLCSIDESLSLAEIYENIHFT